MDIKIHWVSKKYAELSVDEVQSGILNKVEAAELAKKLIDAASELLSVGDEE